jgi:hypothetical protein
MHHALLLEGSFEWALTCIPDFCAHEGPDVIHYRGGRMGIDEVRKLTQAAYQTPLTQPKRHFLLIFDEFTHEAQNALLKLLEEPPLTAQFYLITERTGGLLPTLMSRLARSEEGDRDEHTREDEVAAFFNAAYGERLATILERTNKKDDVWASLIMDAFELYAEKHKDAVLMKKLCEIRPMFALPGASKKMILEHLALLLPPKTQVR